MICCKSSFSLLNTLCKLVGCVREPCRIISVVRIQIPCFSIYLKIHLYFFSTNNISFSKFWPYSSLYIFDFQVCLQFIFTFLLILPWVGIIPKFLHTNEPLNCPLENQLLLWAFHKAILSKQIMMWTSLDFANIFITLDKLLHDFIWTWFSLNYFRSFLFCVRKIPKWLFCMSSIIPSCHGPGGLEWNLLQVAKGELGSYVINNIFVCCKHKIYP